MKQTDYGQFDLQALRDMCGSAEIRYPSRADKATLIELLEEADTWDEIYGGLGQ